VGNTILAKGVNHILAKRDNSAWPKGAKLSGFSRKERIFDDMNNGFGWDRLPKSFMAENTVFLLLTALIRNFYKAIIHRLDVKRFGLNATSRIKAFVFRFVSVPAKWIRTSRRYVLNIYTCNNAYADIFQTDFG
jgi:hypothetical protein